MRCYQTGTSNCTLVQFSNSAGDQNDTGDGGGVSVFVFLSISSHGIYLKLFYFFNRYMYLQLFSPRPVLFHISDELSSSFFHFLIA